MRLLFGFASVARRGLLDLWETWVFLAPFLVGEVLTTFGLALAITKGDDLPGAVLFIILLINFIGCFFWRIMSVKNEIQEPQ